MTATFEGEARLALRFAIASSLWEVAVRYTVRIDVEAPADAGALEELRARGAAQLLAEGFATVVEIRGPEGVVVRPCRVRCVAHDRGAVIEAAVEAPALEDARTGLRLTAVRLLGEHEALAGWRVVACRVRGEVLAASPVVEPAAGPLAVLRAGALSASRADRDRAREHLLYHADRLRAFGAEMFKAAQAPPEGGPPAAVDPQRDRLLAGALMVGVDMLFDGLYHDLDLLQRTGGTAAEVTEAWLLGELPRCAAHRYDVTFVRRFLLVAGTGTHRLTQSRWVAPVCLAEALALRLAYRAACDYVSGHGLLADPQPHFASLEEHTLAPAHVSALRALNGGGLTAAAFEGPEQPWEPATWFAPTGDPAAAHPYGSHSAPVAAMQG
ncbi:hypothetical protein [Salinactinospora qingdaonensis]|uniref:Uncharacterized protein n=1 Tax=Salinactinospora qingdaonensis TaxID=702744 RepID=A0ABP7F047_9ACTN